MFTDIVSSLNKNRNVIVRIVFSCLARFPNSLILNVGGSVTIINEPNTNSGHFALMSLGQIAE